MPWSISQAVLRMSARIISFSVCISASGHWIAWLVDSGLPNGARSLGVGDGLVDAELRRADAEAAWRMRFSCTNVWATARLAALVAEDRRVRHPDVGE